MNRLYFVLFVGVAVSVGCAAAGDSIPPPAAPTSAPVTLHVPREVISLTISLFLLVDDKEEPDPAISTHRSEEDLREILEGMNDIWSQAGIRLDLQTIESVEVPAPILREMLAGNLEPFFRGIPVNNWLPSPMKAMMKCKG